MSGTIFLIYFRIPAEAKPRQVVAQTLTAEIIWWKIFDFILLSLFSIIGYLLIKYTYLEIQRRQEIEKIDKAKSEFISIASHQLRTPFETG